MKTMKAVFATLLCLAMFSSCRKDVVSGSGPILTENRTVTNFSKVTTDGSIDVSITEAATFSVTVSDYENLISNIETYVVGNELKISYRNNVVVTRSRAKVLITMPALQGVLSNGSGDFSVNGVFNTAQPFNAKVNGSGDISINGLTVSSANIEINGSGDMLITNASCNTGTMRTSGSGDINAFGLTCTVNDVYTNGSGDIETTTIQALKARLYGSGDVRYKGSPTIDSRTEGSGRVIRN